MVNGLRIFFLALVGVAHAAPTTPKHYVVHEKRGVLSPAWIKRDRLSGERYLPMRIALTQSELENAEHHLMSVSHPESPNYGNHWDLEKVIETFRPSLEAENQVRQWLIDNGIGAERIAHSMDKGSFHFHAMVDEAEALLAAELHEYEHIDSGALMASCDQYHLPKHISPHVDFVTPGIHLPTPKVRRRMQQSSSQSRRNLAQRGQAEAASSFNKSDLSICAEETTPACIAALYQIPAVSGSVHPNNSLGIYETLLEFYVQSDLDSFFNNYTTNIPNGTHPIAANIDGGQQSSDDIYYAGSEVTIDLQLAYPIIYPQTIVNYQTDDLVYQAGSLLSPGSPVGNNGWDTFIDALDGSFCNFTAYNQTGNSPSDPVYPDPYGGWQGELECGTKTPTNVISISYGGQEVDQALSYQKRECLGWLKLGLRGVSVLVASGDAGTANFPEPYAGNSTPGCIGTNQNMFSPDWPANCPWITAVGATRLWPGQTVEDAESVMARPAILPGHPLNASSGGGFSNVYPRPDYQNASVSDYFEYHDPGYAYYSKLALNTSDIEKKLDPDFLQGDTNGVYNRIGRGYPDVSAIGIHGDFIIGGEYIQYLGTSLSTPIFASVINRINDERLKSGKKTLGFLNPSLYSNPSMLNDISNGTNFGCGDGTEVGFAAVKNWDPATGLGTPNFPKMLEYYMSLP